MAGRHARRIATRDHVAQVEGCLGDIDLGCTGGRIDHRIPIGFLRIDRWRLQRGAEVDARAEVAQRKPGDRLEQKRHVGVQEDGQRSEVAKTHAEENSTQARDGHSANQTSIKGSLGDRCHQISGLNRVEVLIHF